MCLRIKRLSKDGMKLLLLLFLDVLVNYFNGLIQLLSQIVVENYWLSGILVTLRNPKGIEACLD